jgi:NodT family efflux transporter outer membrane factor (OMF) lipoprotein
MSNVLQRLACFVAVLATLTLPACALRGKPPAPAPAMPQAFSEQAGPDAAVLAPDWWRSFGSAELASLIDAALLANPDMAIAAEHVRQAEAQVRIAGATLFPVVDLRLGTTRFKTRPDGGDWNTADVSSATLSASYEIDLWGKNTSGVRAARSSLLATRFDLETFRLTLVAGVASAYFQVLTLRERIATARENLTIAERVLKVVESRVRNGAASEIDLSRQQAGVLALRAAIPPLELQERQTLFALAILLGRQPEGFDAAASTVTDLAVPRVAPGLPATLLVRRPDLASAEAQLAAANANVIVARAALLPSISLTGSAGVASDVLLNFLNGPAAALAVGASLLQPIFNGGQLRAQVDVAASRERELVENYRKSILAALADVESALAAGSRSLEQEVLQEQVVVQARLSLKLAEIRYREGADDLLTVLDAQRTLFQAEDQLAQLRLSRLQASVGLFKALGGGWTLPNDTPTAISTGR